ncbi:DUF4031 domain-containing protein [Microbacterium sp. NPDC087592]|uniref:DUF4031 domain-containing protein n=1 Tax=Microbacterium sp. NPDC087592 TaxID=3364193 RepID=UPI00380C0349
MATYVDDMRRRATVGRCSARWSHLIADTTEELLDFAKVLGLSPEWIQKPGTHREHFDVTDGMRIRALAYGAVPITFQELTAVTRRIRAERRGAESA